MEASENPIRRICPGEQREEGRRVHGGSAEYAGQEIPKLFWNVVGKVAETDGLL